MPTRPAGASPTRATRVGSLPSGIRVTVGRRPRATAPSTRFSSAQPRPMCCSRPNGSTDPVVRAGSRKTSIASGPSRKIHGWVLCGLAASTAQAIAPSGPGVSRHWVQGS